MLDDPTTDPLVLDAVRSFLYADDAPGFAQALREQAARVRAASVATRALIAAVEEWSGPVVFSSGLRHDHLPQLRAHQETWRAACRSTLPGQHSESIRLMLRNTWRKVYLRIIIDRMRAFSVATQFENVTFVRLFCNVFSDFRDGEIMLTDQNYTVNVNISNSSHQDNAHASLSLSMAVVIMDTVLQSGPMLEGEDPIASANSRIIYSYGPIDVNDCEIKIEAIREFAAALDVVEKHILSASRFFNTRVRDKTSVWDYMLKNKISATRFGVAVREYRQVETHTIEVALSRRRRELAGHATQASRDRPLNAGKKIHGAKEKGRKQSPSRAETSPARRSKTTP